MPRPSPQTDRVVAVVELLASRPDQPLTLAAITRHLGVNKSTVYSMLAALTQAGWLLRDPYRKTYRLGPALAAVSRVAAAGFPALEFARGAIEALSRETGANCAALSVADDHVTVVDQVRDLRAIGPGLTISAPIPLRPPLGTVVMAWAPAPQVERWLGQAAEEARPGLRRALAVTRERGYTVELATRPLSPLRDVVAGTAEPGARVTQLLAELADELVGRDDFLGVDLEPDRPYLVGTLNAPVREAGGRVVLVLSLNGFATPLTGTEVGALGRRLVEAAATVTEALGGTAA
ncbi:MAG TPA: helix-turn-helix domain-containing protein [Acidimicrobiales bacterium]